MATAIKTIPARNIDEYIAGFPKNIQNILEEMRATIRKTAPEAEELISYNMPAFKLNGFLVSYAAWKKHIGMYPVPAGNEAFKKKISVYKVEKSTAKFPIDKPLPLDLITKIVKFRVKENLKKVKTKRKRNDK